MTVPRYVLQFGQGLARVGHSAVGLLDAWPQHIGMSGYRGHACPISDVIFALFATCWTEACSIPVGWYGGIA